MVKSLMRTIDEIEWISCRRRFSRLLRPSKTKRHKGHKFKGVILDEGVS